MADVKISELPVATALDGTELVPVVQGGVTSQTTATQLVQQFNGTAATFNALTLLNQQPFGLNAFLEFDSIDAPGVTSASLQCQGTDGFGLGILVLVGAMRVQQGLSVFGAAPPSAKTTLNAAATDLATVIALTNQIRAMLIALGFAQ